MLKLVFLDIDGVLRTGRSITNNNGKARPFDPEAIYNLNKIIKETNCKIVLSSLWRYVYNLEQTKEMFSLEGLPPECIIGLNFINNNEENYSIDQFEQRGMYCLEWIKSYSKNNDFDGKIKYVVIDDMIDILANLPEETIFITDSFFGLTTEISNDIITYLNS